MKQYDPSTDSLALRLQGEPAPQAPPAFPAMRPPAPLDDAPQAALDAPQDPPQAPEGGSDGR